LRLEDQRGQDPFRKTTEKIGSAPLLSVSLLGIDLTGAGVLISWFPSAIRGQDQRKWTNWSDCDHPIDMVNTSRILPIGLLSQVFKVFLPKVGRCPCLVVTFCCSWTGLKEMHEPVGSYQCGEDL
jgi:hypothetical protein